jgi:hypothetical protein
LLRTRALRFPARAVHPDHHLHCARIPPPQARVGLHLIRANQQRPPLVWISRTIRVCFSARLHTKSPIRSGSHGLQNRPRAALQA